MLRIGLGDGCPYCGNLAVYRSHPETLLDRACWLLLLEVARCPGCMRQHYRPLLFAAPSTPLDPRRKSTRLPNPEIRLTHQVTRQLDYAIS